MVHVPYKGNAAAITALISGEVQMTISDAGLLAQHMKSGKVRGLAVTSSTPSALAPGMPTVSVTVPGYEAIGVTGLFIPTGTPAAIINRLNQEITRFLNRPETKEKFFSAGAEVVASTPEQFAAFVKADIAKMAKVIKDAGIKPN
jgi:tripartite-type tricarboxylate transporter receptor subunit TctC